ncbi:MAG: hypothetical protein A3F82_02995 [Deltaproteobacteria bacterium RIFCSPLOWO2_12_FULL_44_12]|nr:MAG: hypothetical protein A3I70_05450 [Deltaproteobacteria bacterium RIFCSPLOWO2_02_FULL_44_34]OGQ69548.1 MAG: hypothetical protein A3F82_02995 [Deltaproteobacteria bacterium RIFCSPLOWO2_12_FULL_44_12]
MNGKLKCICRSALAVSLLTAMFFGSACKNRPPSSPAAAKTDSWNHVELSKQAKALLPSAIPELRVKATAGDAKSQFLLGLVNELGHAGVTQNLSEALVWHRKAADQEIGLPQAWVGDFYYAGIGIPVDFGEALRWYRRSCDNRYLYACRIIGRLYLTGKGVERDYAQARRWFQTAADGNDEASRKIMADLERNCSTPSCIDLQTLITERSDQFYLLQGESLGQTTEKEDLYEQTFKTVTRRWRGTFSIRDAQNCEVRSKESELTSSTKTYYTCSLGKDLSEAETDARFDIVTKDILAATPSSVKITYCGKEGCGSTPTSNRFTFSAVLHEGGGINVRNQRTAGTLDRNDLLLVVSEKD